MGNSISDEEKEDIGRYKDYANDNLPGIEKLSDLVVMNYDRSAYPDLDKFDALGQYLSELKPYLKVLTEAAGLREHHYQRWIKDQKVEDEGHRLWREGMNNIAEDAQEKFLYWSEIHEKMMSKIIADCETRPDQLMSMDLCTKNVDPFFYKDANEKKEIKEKSKRVYYKRPKLSPAQKKKLAAARKKQQKRLDARDHAVLDEAVEKSKLEYQTMVGPDMVFDADFISQHWEDFKYDYSGAGQLMGNTILKGSQLGINDCASFLSQSFYNHRTRGKSTQRSRDNWQLFLSLIRAPRFGTTYMEVTLQLFLENHFTSDRFMGGNYGCSFAFAQCLNVMSFNEKILPLMEPIFRSMVRSGEEKQYEDFLHMFRTMMVDGPCLARITTIIGLGKGKYSNAVLNGAKNYRLDVTLVHGNKKYRTDKRLLQEVKTMEKMFLKKK